jgi:hypothetical protein
MIQRRFSLQPFPSPDALDDIHIAGCVARRAGTFLINFTLVGPLAALAMPAPAAPPARRHGLWEGTCFEFFLALVDSPQYWEFNLSPSGCWNVYTFSAYREGMREEGAFTSLPFEAVREERALALGLEINLQRLVHPDEPVDVAASAVIERKGGILSYWALMHCGPRPDFHRRESFTMRLPGVRDAPRP